MHPTLIRAPFHRPRLGLRVYVEKVDGWRIVAYKDRDRGRLVSRNGVDHTRRVRDLAATITKLSARTLVLDGEIAIYDQQPVALRLAARAGPGRRRHAAALHVIRHPLPRRPRPGPAGRCVTAGPS